MNQFKSNRILFVLAIVIGLVAIGARIAGMHSRVVLQHDDAISYLAATGHQGQYQELSTSGESPFAQWGTMQLLHRLIRSDDTFIFSHIGYDLAYFDTHPPLYFWLLHLWTLVFGTGLTNALWLNLLFDIATAVLIWRFARKLTPQPVYAVIAVGLWSLSHTSIFTAIIVRHYSLFTLLTLCHAYQTYNLTVDNRKSMRVWLPIVIVSICGLLTHYFFIFVLLASFLWLLQSQTARYKFILGMCIAGIVVLLIDPYYLHPILGRVSANASADLEMPVRVQSLFTVIFIMFIDNVFWFVVIKIVTNIYLLALAMVVIMLLIVFRKRLLRRFSTIQMHVGDFIDRPGLKSCLLCYCVVVSLGIIGLYFIGFSPVHALDDRYISMIVPFVVLLLLGWLSGKKVGEYVFIAFFAIVLISALSYTVYTFQKSANNADPDRMPSAVIIDGTGRGFVIATAFYFDASVPVHITHDPLHVLENDIDSLPNVNQEANVFLVIRDDDEGMQELIDKFNSAGFSTTLLNAPPWGYTSFLVLMP